MKRAVRNMDTRTNLCSAEAAHCIMRNGTSMHSCFTTTRKRVHLKANMQFKKGGNEKKIKITRVRVWFRYVTCRTFSQLVGRMATGQSHRTRLQYLRSCNSSNSCSLCGGNNAIPGSYSPLVKAIRLVYAVLISSPCTHPSSSNDRVLTVSWTQHSAPR